MTPDDEQRLARVTAALHDLGHDVDLLVSQDATHTAQQAAAAAGCELGQIVKTLVVFVRDTPMFVLVPGDRRLDDRLVAARFGVGRKQVRLASAEEVLDLTGYPVGGVSPFGATTALKTLVDESFNRFDTIWLACGNANAIFPLALTDAVALTAGEFAHVAT
jgi:Cys-tRNA(Pro) deacylase